MSSLWKVTLPILFYLVFISCTNGSGRQDNDRHKIPDRGVVNASIVCRSHPEITYAVYIPKTAKHSLKMPLILAFDPHASGSVPVEKYKSLAEQYGFILAASNNSMNGQSAEMSELIFQKTMNDILSLFPVDSARIILTGFSGGARVAGLMALTHSGIDGVIACGAGLPGINPMPEIHFDFYSIAGLGDFNLNELYRINRALEGSGVRHFMGTFSGKHEWPPTETFEDAILWLNLSGQTGPSRVEVKLSELKKDQTYIRQQEYREKILKKEEEEQQTLMESMLSKDLSWWKNKIAKYEAEAGNDQDMEICWMHQRLLGFLSLFCYSRANAALTQDNRQMASKMICIYTMSDPENPEPNYLQSILYMRNNDINAAISKLKQAINKGFKDKSRIVQQREFQDLQSNQEFFEILQKMK